MPTAAHRAPPAAVTIGVDVGATKLSAGLLTGEGAVVDCSLVRSPLGDYDAALAIITMTIRRLQHVAASRGMRVLGAGIAVAAFLDTDRAGVRYAANLKWTEHPLRLHLENRLEIPITLVNDADAAAWGEYVHGAGRGFANLFVVTIGTGVGGGVISNGRLVTGGHGAAGEIGHLRVAADGRACQCGARGCLEQYASGPALARIAAELAIARPRQAQVLLRLADNRPEKIAGPHVTEAAQNGDRVAKAAFDQVGEWLAVGLAKVTAILDPSMILLGGGVAAAGELLLAPTRGYYTSRLGIPGLDRGGTLHLAGLGHNAGLVGAAALAHAHLDARRSGCRRPAWR